MSRKRRRSRPPAKPLLPTNRTSNGHIANGEHAGEDDTLGVVVNPAGRWRLPLPREPTDTTPATAARVEIYRQRYATRVALWHPGDTKADGEPPAP
jgi:hypothetical protein